MRSTEASSFAGLHFMAFSSQTDRPCTRSPASRRLLSALALRARTDSVATWLELPELMTATTNARPHNERNRALHGSLHTESHRQDPWSVICFAGRIVSLVLGRGGKQSGSSGGRFDALVLAGSYGWGASHLPSLPPRPLAPVALRPAIAYALDWLNLGGAGDITICANQSAGLLRERLGFQHREATLLYKEDQSPRGPAGSLLDAAAELHADTLVVVEGTLIPTVNLADLLDAHRRTGATMTVVAARQGAHVAPAGIYVLNRSALAHIRPSGFQDLKETLLPRLYEAGARVLPWTPSEYIPRVATVASYLSTNAWVVERLAAAGRIDAHEAVVHAKARLVWPVLLGARTRIGAGATIVGPAVIGDGCEVSEGALVSRSVIGNHCRIAAGAIVHGSVVLEHASVDAGIRLHRRLHVPSTNLASRIARLVTRTRHPHTGDAPAVALPSPLPIDDAHADAWTTGTQRP
jgi:mannose-1-phosphate guanylyltransferase